MNGVNEYGTVISTLEGPSTRRFSFVINKDAVVRRGQFVQLKTGDGILLGRVADVYKTNRYFMRPESVKEYESSGRPMDDIFPVGDWEYLVADVIALGVFNDKDFQDSDFPPSPGTKVMEPERDLIGRFFGFDGNGIHIGDLSYHDLEVKINLTRLLQKHLAVLALSGAGKSYLTSVLIEELLDRKEEAGQMAVIIIDPHGEYSCFADDPRYSSKTRVFASDEIRIGLPRISPYELSSYMPELTSHAQERVLIKNLSELRRSKKNYSINDLIEALEEKDMNQTTKDVLLALLDNLRMSGLFGINDYPGVHELAKQGNVSIIDLYGTTNLRKKQIIVNHTAKVLFEARTRGLIPPFLLILEEAHQFAPEKAKKEYALSRGILQRIAREGRKFNASLCLISQRPVQLSTTILSQCNTNLILRITNPYDLKHIGESSEGITKDVLDQISSLKVGTGLIVGEGVNFPVFVKIRGRHSKESGKGSSIESVAVEFSKNRKDKEKDAKEFM
jgi:DNA helicase HerA-like ATPase